MSLTFALMTFRFLCNIRAFHDAVLELGSVPLPVVPARIDRFIAEDGKGPYPDMEWVVSECLGERTDGSRRALLGMSALTS